MARPMVPHRFPRRGSGGWGLSFLCVGAFAALFWRQELGRYGIAVVCVAGLVGFVLDELTSKRGK